MSTSDWRQLGFLNPDALECQQDVWALQARWRTSLADVLADLSARTAEPTWGASLEEGAHRARELAGDLREEAGEEAGVRVDDDVVVREFEAGGEFEGVEVVEADLAFLQVGVVALEAVVVEEGVDLWRDIGGVRQRGGEQDQERQCQTLGADGWHGDPARGLVGR